MLVLALLIPGVTCVSHIPLGTCSTSSVSQLPLESLVGDLGLGEEVGSACPLLPCLQTVAESPHRVTWMYFLHRHKDNIKTSATVTKWEKGFCVTEVKKKVSFVTLVNRDSDPSHSFCSCIEAGTKERKQITLYLADGFHLLIRSFSYCSAIGPISVGAPGLKNMCTASKRDITCARGGSRPITNAVKRRKISICELASKGEFSLSLFPAREKSIIFVLTCQKNWGGVLAPRFCSH